MVLEAMGMILRNTQVSFYYSLCIAAPLGPPSPLCGTVWEGLVETPPVVFGRVTASLPSDGRRAPWLTATSEDQTRTLAKPEGRLREACPSFGNRRCQMGSVGTRLSRSSIIWSDVAMIRSTACQAKDCRVKAL